MTLCPIITGLTVLGTWIQYSWILVKPSADKKSRRILNGGL
jgi:hypothetical protein